MQGTNQIWIKDIECPLCYEEFSVENVWLNKVSVVEEYADLGKKYNGTNPLFYSVWVCPACFYADLKGDSFFSTGKINDEAFEEEYPILKMLAKGLDFREARTFSHAVTSYKLAFLVTEFKKASRARLGALNLRLAWLYRAIKKRELEMEYISYSLANFLEAYTKEANPDFGNLSPGGVIYLLGELSRQVGDHKTAVNFFYKAITDKKLVIEPKYIKLARNQWQNLRENKIGSEIIEVERDNSLEEKEEI